MVVLASLTSMCAVPLSLPSFLHQLLCAVVATVAAEVSEDKKYLAALEVESFGILVPFTLKLEDATS